MKGGERRGRAAGEGFKGARLRVWLAHSGRVGKTQPLQHLVNLLDSSGLGTAAEGRPPKTSQRDAIGWRWPTAGPCCPSHATDRRWPSSNGNAMQSREPVNGWVGAGMRCCTRPALARHQHSRWRVESSGTHSEKRESSPRKDVSLVAPGNCARSRSRETKTKIKQMPSPAEIACPVASRIQALSATHSTGRSTLLPGPNAMAFRLTLVLFAVLAPVQAALFLR